MSRLGSELRFQLGAVLSIFLTLSLSGQSLIRTHRAVENKGSFLLESWKTRDGLPSNSVHCLTQSSDGFIWLGTAAGLVRFDGLNFDHFSQLTMPTNRPTVIKALLEDSYQRLWIASKGGLWRRYGNTFEKFDSDDGLIDTEITCLASSQSGGLWVGTPNGLSYVEQSSSSQDRMTRLNVLNYQGLSNPSISAVFEDDQGRVLVGTLQGLLSLDVKTGDFQSIWSEPIPNNLPEYLAVRTIMQDRLGTIWFGTDHSVYRSDKSFVQPFAVRERGASSRVEHIFEDHDGGVWCIIGGRLYVQVEDAFVPFSDDPLLQTSWASAIFQDRELNLWIGNRFGGLQQLRSTAVSVYTIKDGLPHPSVRSVSLAKDGTLWIGTDGGIVQFINGSFEVFAGDDGISEVGYRSLLEDSCGNLWMGSDYRGLFRRQAHKYGDRVYNNFTLLGHPRVFLEDSRGDLWIGSTGGLSRYVDGPHFYDNVDFQGDTTNPNCEHWGFHKTGLNRWAKDGTWLFEAGEWKYMTGSQDAEFFSIQSLKESAGADWIKEIPDGSFSDFDIRVLHEGKNGTLWVGTGAGGLNQVNRGRIKAFTVDDGLSSNEIRAIYEDQAGVLWLGTGEGIDRFENGDIDSVSQKQALFNGPVNQILEDHEGYLWISTSKGIYRVQRMALNELIAGDRSSVESLRFGEHDGMLSEETAGNNQPAGCVDEMGIVWFPTSQGLVEIDPSAVRNNVVKPSVYFREIRVDGGVFFDAGKARVISGEIDVDGTGATHTLMNSSEGAVSLQFPKDAGKRIEIHYSARSFTSAVNVRFKYRLNGYDQGWIDAGSRRVAFYTNLEPGPYEFQVKACSHHGVWDEPGRTLSFIIPRPWHASPYFQIGFGMAVIVVAWTLVQLRLKALRQKAIINERERISRDLHDNLGANLVQVHSMIGKMGQDLSGPVEGKITQAKSKLNEMHLVLKNLATGLHAQEITLTRAIHRLRAFSFQYLEPTDLALDFCGPEHSIDSLVPSDWANDLVMMVQEMLANAASHSNGTRVNMIVKVLDPYLQLVCMDDGQGIDPSKSLDCCNGLNNIRDRAARHGGHLSIESSAGKGTQLNLILPYSFKRTFWRSKANT